MRNKIGLKQRDNSIRTIVLFKLGAYASHRILFEIQLLIIKRHLRLDHEMVSLFIIPQCLVISKRERGTRNEYEWQQRGAKRSCCPKTLEVWIVPFASILCPIDWDAWLMYWKDLRLSRVHRKNICHQRSGHWCSFRPCVFAPTRKAVSMISRW